MITAQIHNTEAMHTRSTATFETVSDAAQWSLSQIIGTPYLVARLYVDTTSIGSIILAGASAGLMIVEAYDAEVKNGVEHYLNSTRCMPVPLTLKHHKVNQ